MSAATWFAVGLFAVVSVALWASVNRLYAVLMSDPMPGRRTRRRMLRRLGTVTGLWQVSVAVVIVVVGPSGWPSAIGVGGMGCLFMFGSWVARKTGLPPWWAPE